MYISNNNSISSPPRRLVFIVEFQDKMWDENRPSYPLPEWEIQWLNFSPMQSLLTFVNIEVEEQLVIAWSHRLHLSMLYDWNREVESQSFQANICMDSTLMLFVHLQQQWLSHELLELLQPRLPWLVVIEQVIEHLSWKSKVFIIVWIVDLSIDDLHFDSFDSYSPTFCAVI